MMQLVLNSEIFREYDVIEIISRNLDLKIIYALKELLDVEFDSPVVMS